MEEENKTCEENKSGDDNDVAAATPAPVEKRSSIWEWVVIIVLVVLYQVFAPQLADLQIQRIVRRATYFVAEELKVVMDCDDVSVTISDTLDWGRDIPSSRRRVGLMMDAEGCGKKIMDYIGCETRNYVSVSCDLFNLRYAYIVTDSDDSETQNNKPINEEDGYELQD